MQRQVQLVLGICALLVLAAVIAAVVPTGGLEPRGAVAFAGDYAVEINLDPDDPGVAHDPFIGMPDNMTLHFAKQETPQGIDVTITGPAPWVEVQGIGRLNSEGVCFFGSQMTFTAAATGVVAGHSNIRVVFGGQVDFRGLFGTLTMGGPHPAGTQGNLLPGGQAITYTIKPKGEGACPLTPPSPTSPPTATQPAQPTATQPAQPTATQPSQPTATVPPAATATAGPSVTATPPPTATQPAQATATQPSQPTATVPPTPTGVPGNGDVNKNGVINSIDALLLLQHIAGHRDLGSPRLANADVNQDGVVDSRDATIILQYISGFVSVLPVPPR